MALEDARARRIRRFEGGGGYDEEEEEDDYEDENEIESDEIALQYTVGEEFEDFDGYTLEELEELVELTGLEIELLEES